MFHTKTSVIVTFVDPHLLWLLLVVPVLGVWSWWVRRRQGGLRYSDVGLTGHMEPSWRVRFRGLPTVLRLFALALGIVALARPQVRDVIRTKTAEGIDVMLVLDASSSMQAEDFRPNRFEAAREVAANFVDGRVSDRVGLVVFASEAYTQVPLTLDYGFLRRMLDRVEIGRIEDGTAIGTALATAVNRLKDTASESKVVVLLTDGRNNRGEVDPATAAEIARTMNVRVYPIGVGTADGKGESGGQFEERRGASDGVDEQMLRTVASTTGGRYFSATSKEALERIYQEIDRMETTEIDERVYTDREEWYPWFLGPAFALVVLEVLLRTTLLRRFP